MMYDDFIYKFLNELGEELEELENYNNDYDDCDWDCERDWDCSLRAAAEGAMNWLNIAADMRRSWELSRDSGET